MGAVGKLGGAATSAAAAADASGAVPGEVAEEEVGSADVGAGTGVRHGSGGGRDAALTSNSSPDSGSGGTARHGDSAPDHAGRRCTHANGNGNGNGGGCDGEPGGNHLEDGRSSADHHATLLALAKAKKQLVELAVSVWICGRPCGAGGSAMVCA
eukprot:125685-Chlamydomonas_euryale.AAC.2